MNREVDVMDGDRFTVINGHVSQWRGRLWRYVRLNHVGEWESLGTIFTETTIDLPTFTRYCEGCGLTVKHVKPEPAVETIKPPEYGVENVDNGEIKMFSSREKRDLWCKVQQSGDWKPIRVD